MKLGRSMTVERRSETFETADDYSASPRLAAHRTGKAPDRPNGSDESLGGTEKRLPGIAAREPLGLGVPIGQIKKPKVEPAWCRRSSSIQEVRSSQQASTRFLRPESWLNRPVLVAVS